MGPVCATIKGPSVKSNSTFAPCKLGLFWPPKGLNILPPQNNFSGANCLIWEEYYCNVSKKSFDWILYNMTTISYRWQVVNMNPAVIVWVWTKTIRCTVHSPVVFASQRVAPKVTPRRLIGQKSPRRREAVSTRRPWNNGICAWLYFHTS